MDNPEWIETTTREMANKESPNGKGTTFTILRTNYVIPFCFKVVLVGHGTRKSKNKYLFICVVTTRHNTTTNYNKKTDRKITSYMACKEYNATVAKAQNKSRVYLEKKREPT